ncbi:MAG: methyl-accepting chemotaxis protein [Rhodocyclaceae bacterium]|nr:methyl-accepting chemotaxis protein [Rhodocyclaceae bacterium]
MVEMLIGFLAGVAVAVPVGMRLTRGSDGPAAEETARQVEAGRLDIELGGPGAVARAANAIRLGARDLLGSIGQNAGCLQRETSELSRISESMLANSDAQQADAQAIRESVERIETRTGEIAEIGQQVQQLSHHSSAIIVESTDAVAAGLRAFAELTEFMAFSRGQIEELAERSRQIAGIVTTISGIAKQTDLLALNAAIEAARAGENGRGFAVVADEVRNLAEGTTSATENIRTVIEEMTERIDSVVESIRTGTARAREASEISGSAGAGLERIDAEAKQTMARVDEMVEIIGRHANDLGEISSRGQDITRLVEQGISEAAMVSRSASRLASLSSNLGTLKQIFSLGKEAERVDGVHREMADQASTCAARIAEVLEQAIACGRLREEDVFDHDYRPIDGTRPQKYHTRYDAFSDDVFPSIQEPVIDVHDLVVYAGAVDINGYFPTHNRRFSQPLTGDYDRDLLTNRTKRIFDDPVGKRCGAHELPVLLQTYRRDTGELMHDVSAPITVLGRHWGGFRIGYRA